MAIMYPVSGGFYTLADRFLDPSFAFAMGWNYCFQWFAALPLEITVAGTTVQYWTDEVPIAAWITIFWAVISASGFPHHFRFGTDNLQSSFLSSEHLVTQKRNSGHHV